MRNSLFQNRKRLGILIIVPAALLLGWTIIYSIFMTILGFDFGVNISGMFPFLGLTLVKLIILIFAFYLAVRLIKGKPLPFKQNNYLAIALIVIGIVYFAWQLVTTLIDNISGLNPGGWAQPILAFLWGAILVFVGVGIGAGGRKKIGRK